MRDDERDQVAKLIHLSTNHWYKKNRGFDVFPGDTIACRLFTDVYEDLDPECCLVEEADDGRIMGSCFYHPRETHVSLGIMNAHPEAAGLGVARKLLAAVIEKAAGKPVRLVSSAMNLDSYSLYTKAGFTPQTLYQDMQFLGSPDFDQLPKHSGTIREATMDDAVKMADLEMKLTGIRREKDYRYFVENQRDLWKTLVLVKEGNITGFLNSVTHPVSHMLGPGVCTDWQCALALIAAHHQLQAKSQPVFLVPAIETKLIDQLYQLGARNLELHVSQVRGDSPPQKQGSVLLPTFMPETG